MQIGLSLPVTYLVGTISDKADQFWEDIYGSADQALRELKKMGVTSLEVNKVNQTITSQMLQQAVQMVLDIGLQVTIHGWLPDGAEYKSLPGNVLDVQSLLAQYSPGDVAFTVHAHEFSEARARKEAIEMSLRDLLWFSEDLNTQESPLAVALEVCRIKESGPVGTTYDEVFSLAQKTGFSENLGICWDLGHTQANYRLNKDVAYPNEEFAKRVIHTHIHDIGPDGRTHGPTIFSEGYLADGIELLKSVGYNRSYNLELYPPRWGMSPKECKRKLEKSINTVAKMVMGG